MPGIGLMVIEVSEFRESFPASTLWKVPFIDDMPVEATVACLVLPAANAIHSHYYTMRWVVDVGS